MRTTYLLLCALLVSTLSAQTKTKTEKPMLSLTMRSMKPIPGEDGKFEKVEKVVSWEPQKTAIVVCDMWDKHWCSGATERVGEMAPVLNAVLKAARKKGVLIVHAPSDTMDFYTEAPQRKRAQEAPPVPPVSNFKNPRPAEPPLPIDDSDGGCDTGEPPWHKAWSRQHPALEIAPEDIISDSGDEVASVFFQRGVTNVILLGVHTNMCVLGRSFAIRSMVQRGLNVALMRDMTDTMYNPKKSPYVSHFRGTDLVVEHIEKYWCPSLTSRDFTGKPAFRFKADTGK
jgi:nicotinamidase-related amidase